QRQCTRCTFFQACQRHRRPTYGPGGGNGFAGTAAGKDMRAVHHGARSWFGRLLRGPHPRRSRRTPRRPSHVPMGAARADRGNRARGGRSAAAPAPHNPRSAQLIGKERMPALSNLAARDVETLAHPYTNLAAFREEGPLVLERGQGVYVYDTAGKPYLEGMAGLWCTALGYGNEELVAAAIEQMRKLPFAHLFTGKSHDPAIEL